MLYVRDEYTKRHLRVTEEEEKGTEIIHVRMESIPPINIIGVYMDTNQTKAKAENTHNIITEKVQSRDIAGENCVGDTNAAINRNFNKVTPATKLILDWENTGKVRILNNKSELTHVPYIKGQEENCIDFAFGLEKDLKSFTLDTKCEWTPETAEWTRKRKGEDKVYKRGKVSDHKAFKIVFELNIVAKRQ